MKKLLVLLLLLPLVATSAYARMFPTEFPIQAVCWDDIEEAVEYHQDILGEYPVGKGWISNRSFASIMFNPTKPSWTLLSFYANEEDGVIVCAITTGTQWDIINPGDEAEKLEL